MTSQPNRTNGHATKHTNWIGETEDDYDSNSVTKSYHRMTAEKAREHVEDLQKSDSEDARRSLEKLIEDERRITECRARIAKNPSTKKLQEELKISFEQWWQDAKSDKATKIKHSWKDRKVLVKSRICPELDSDTTEIRYDDDPAHDMKAYFMFFEKDGQEWRGKTVHNQGFPEYEEFPNQRISIHTALHSDAHNPFKPTDDDNDENGQPRLRYIHIPANHMGWIEQAMARYYDEDGIKDVKDRGKTNKTLSREFWKGQLHGSGPGRNPIHATHMRSRCSIIPGETQSLVVEQKQNSTTQKDMAVFMPYLHWETSARRARMAKAVKAILKEEENKNPKSKYRTTRSATLRQGIDKKWKNLFQTKEQKHREIASKMMEPTTQPTKLGKYLMSLAQLWDAMDMELDERLVKHGLISQGTNGKPPEPLLHIRRTLDQSYFLNLNDTSQRDQDQVVYRATWGHGNLTRVVMVDQLWLWVLDEHTVITSFPKRWGRNKPDSSGIHKSLRVRLGQPGFKVMSAWHLAFIIIDQCSNVFFDRTQPLDLRPEVMDIFAETLGDVNHYTTIAFKVFWDSVERFSQSRDSRGSNRQNQKYLNINPEGTLLREAQDIAEELQIMNGIFSQQLGVVKSFQKCLEHMNGQSKTRTKQQHLFGLIKDLGTSSQADEIPVSLAEMDFLEDLVEEVENRKSEIVDLESAALHTCEQLQELLSLKQQQASIVEAKAAIERADQSVEQGKAIMAFTIMTIIFTPLGFFTSFFGMNHSLTGDDWMTLANQCIYMFCISAAIIVIALSLAFKGSQLRQFIKSLRDPKARWKDLKNQWKRLKDWWDSETDKPGQKRTARKGKDRPNERNSARTIDNSRVDRQGGTNGVKDYFRVRNNTARSDVENPRPEHEYMTAGIKTED